MRTRVRYLLAFMVSLLMASSGVSAQATGGPAMLHDAVRTNDIAQLRTVIDGGADMEARDGQGRTALLLATRAGAVDLAGLLVEAGANVNAKDSIQDTPFLYAGTEGQDEILGLILATGKAKLNDTNRYGGTALIPAAHHGHPSTVRILLDTAMDIDHVNDLGWTALLEAVILSDGGPVHQEIVGLLVDAGAKSLADRDGRTSLDHARAMGFTEIAERIVAGPQK